jgi:hypothetical protein
MKNLSKLVSLYITLIFKKRNDYEIELVLRCINMYLDSNYINLKVTRDMYPNIFVKNLPNFTFCDAFYFNCYIKSIWYSAFIVTYNIE